MTFMEADILATRLASRSPTQVVSPEKSSSIEALFCRTSIGEQAFGSPKSGQAASP